MLAEWKKPMLGQLVDSASGRRWGSIFKNEMEFHMFTRRSNGFCDLCDLQPTFESPEKGHTRPGRLFHSRADHFRDPRFPDWKSNKLFTFTSEYPHEYSSLVRYNEIAEKEFEPELPLFDQFRFLSGTQGECQAYRDLILSGDSEGTLLEFTRYTRATWMKESPGELEPYLGDVTSAPFPDSFVSRINHGWRIYLRFEGKFEDLESGVGQLERCLKGESRASDLDDLPPCRVRGYLGSLWQEHRSFHSDSFRAIYDDVIGAGEQLVVHFESTSLKEFAKFRLTQDQVNFVRDLPPTVPQTDMLSEHVTPHRPIRLWRQVENLMKELGAQSHIKVEFERSLGRFRVELNSALHEYRLGRGDDVRRVLEEFLASGSSPEQTLRLLKKEKEDQVGRMVEEATGQGARQISPGDVTTGEQHVLLLLYSEFSAICIQNFKLFMRVLEKRVVGGQRFDHFYLELAPGRGSSLVKTGGRMTSDDLLNDLRNRPIRYRVMTHEPRPSDITSNQLLSFPCPFSWSGGCPTHHNRWTCDVCKTLVRYHGPVDTPEVSCNCGLSPFDRLRFMCQHPNHGIMPRSRDIVEERTPRGELTCILIGGRGSGKSTLINSLSNYLSFKSLEEASLRKPTLGLIPTAYARVGADDEISVVAVDESPEEEEVLLEGHTHTLRPRSYLFPLDQETLLRLVDTSGYAKDEQAEGRVDAILELIGQYREIHSICFVLNSQAKRPSKAFSDIYWGIREALGCGPAHILFMFTNYKAEPVPTWFIQKVKTMAELNVDNSFRLNNQAFPHLLSRDERSSALDSMYAKEAWSWAATECCRWITRIQETVGTLSLPPDQLPPLEQAPPQELELKPEPILPRFGPSSNHFKCQLAQNFQLASDKTPSGQRQITQ